MPEICCASLKVKYLKRSGKVKEINRKSLDLNYVKLVLDMVVNNKNFKKFVDIEISNVCMKIIPGGSETDTNSEYEGDISDNSEN